MKRIFSFNGRRESIRDIFIILKSIIKVIISGNFILGKKLESFESNLSDYLGNDLYSVGVNSCTDALYLSLKLFDIGEGDEVIVQSNTAIPTVNSIVMTGATPVFVDVDDSYQMSIDNVFESITEKTKAVIVVHLFGDCCDVDLLSKICKDNSIKLVEDCAQSFGASFNGKKLGTFGDTSCFSFYPTKILGGYGDGGAIVTKSKEYSKKLKRMRFHGIDRNSMGYYTIEYAPNTMNSRLDEIHATILSYKLKKVDNLIRKRNKIAKYYLDNIINPSIRLPKIKTGSVYYNFVVRTSNRDLFIEKLKENNIFVNINYPYPIHLMDGYSYIKNKSKLENTELLCNEIFNLPIFPTLKMSEVKKIVRIINNIKI